MYVYEYNCTVNEAYSLTLRCNMQYVCILCQRIHVLFKHTQLCAVYGN